MNIIETVKNGKLVAVRIDFSWEEYVNALTEKTAMCNPDAAARVMRNMEFVRTEERKGSRPVMEVYFRPVESAKRMEVTNDQHKKEE